MSIDGATVAVAISGYKYKITVGQNSLKKYVYLRRQQERGLLQKTRRLMDKSTVSFQMFLIQLSFIAIGSESQISVDQVTLYSSNVKRILRCLGFLVGGGGEHAQKLKLGDSFFSEKKTVQFLVSLYS